MSLFKVKSLTLKYIVQVESNTSVEYTVNEEHDESTTHRKLSNSNIFKA